VFALGSLLCLAGAAPAGTFAVPDVQLSFQNLTVGVPGASTADSVTFGNYVVGPDGLPNLFSRPIVPFPRAGFDPIADRPILGARLFFRSTEDFTEPGEAYGSEVRLFTTAETDLRVDNADVFAGLTGDGGPYAAIGPVELTDGDRQARRIEFPPDAVAALDAAIHGDDPTIGVAFREFIGNDVLDGFAFGVPPRVMRIQVDVPAAVPPLCDVETSAGSYADGDTVVLSRLRFANPDVVAISVRIRLSLEVPGIGTIDPIVASTPELRASFDRDVGPATLFAVGPQLPRGVWGVRCAVEDLASGELLASDATSFALQ
jgi:hypothetical protein